MCGIGTKKLSKRQKTTGRKQSANGRNLGERGRALLRKARDGFCIQSSRKYSCAILSGKNGHRLFQGAVHGVEHCRYMMRCSPSQVQKRSYYSYPMRDKGKSLSKPVFLGETSQ